jgi:trehalose 6-phosphate synthase
VLSQFAGAAQELDGALIVNPHEPEGMAESIKIALDMSLADRKQRQHRMFEHLAANDIDRWAERFLTALGETGKQPLHVSPLSRARSRTNQWRSRSP